MEHISDLTDGNPADVIVISESVTDGKPTDVAKTDYPGIDAFLDDYEASPPMEPFQASSAFPIDQDPDESSEFEDISENDMHPEASCGFCEKTNVKKKCSHPNCTTLGVRFCDKFCAIRYHAKQKAMEDIDDDDDEEEMPKKKKKYKKRKPRHSRHKQHVNQNVLLKIAARRRKTPKDPLKYKSKCPFEDMSVDTLKPFVVSLVESFISWKDPTGIGLQVKQQAYSFVAHATRRSENFVQQQVIEWESNKAFRQSQRGKHAKIPSKLDEEQFRDGLFDYIKAESRQRGRKNLTSDMLADYVNNVLLEIEDEEDKYTARTMRNWIHKLGFTYREPKKATYFDGHERPDNIIDRKRLYDQIKGIEGLLTFDPVTGEPNNLDSATKILVVQDETSQESNDVQRFFWGNDDMNFPPPKSRGIKVMSSDFVDELHGYLQYSDEVWPEVKTRPDIEKQIKDKGGFQARIAGRIVTTGEEYYNAKQCEEDFKKAADIIKTNSNGKLAPIFLVDHSPIHKAKPEDSLNADYMNMGVGGKQRKMRNGYYFMDNEDGESIRIEQSMVFEEDHEKAGMAKGLKVVCTERFGEEFVRGKTKKQLQTQLSLEDDFKDQKTIIAEAVAPYGGEVIFGVKFHPELSAIEACYRSLTKYLREHNIIGCSKGYVQRYELGLQTITVEMVRKFFASCYRFLEAYQMEGCDGENVKTYERELKRIELLKKPQTVHRGAVTLDNAGDEPKVKRNKYKSFLRAYQEIPGTETLPQDAPPMEVTSESDDDIIMGLEGFADALDENEIQFAFD